MKNTAQSLLIAPNTKMWFYMNPYDENKEEVFSVKGICPACGIGLESLDPRLFSFNSKQGACPDCDGLGQVEDPQDREPPIRWVCPQCNGSRLKKEALSVKLGPYSIWNLVQQSPGKLQQLLKTLPFGPHEMPIAEPIMTEILTRISLLNQLGLSYLSLARSGGIRFPAERPSVSNWPNSSPSHPRAIPFLY